MKLSKVQFGRAVTVLGIRGTKDFLTSEDVSLDYDTFGLLSITTLEGEVTLVPVHNVIYMNVAPTSDKTPKKEINEVVSGTTGTKATEAPKQAAARPTDRAGSAAVKAGKPR